MRVAASDGGKPWKRVPAGAVMIWRLEMKEVHHNDLKDEL